MQRWKAYMESTRADRRRAEAVQVDEQQRPVLRVPEPGDGAYPDCEPYPRAT